MVKRTKHSADFKSKVALAAIREQKTAAQLASDFSLHVSQITSWKKQLMDAIPEVFSGGAAKAAKSNEAETDNLYQQIGQLKVELDWIKKKSGINR